MRGLKHIIDELSIYAILPVRRRRNNFFSLLHEAVLFQSFASSKLPRYEVVPRAVWAIPVGWWQKIIDHF